MRGQSGNKGGAALMFGTRKPRILSKQQQQALLTLAKSMQNKQLAKELFLMPANLAFEQALIDLHAEARINKFRKQCKKLSAKADLLDVQIKQLIRADYLDQSFTSKDEIESWLDKTLAPNHFPKNDQGIELMRDYIEGENDLQQKLLFGSSAVKAISKESDLDVIQDATFSVALKMLVLEQDKNLHESKLFDHKDYISKLKKLPYYAEKDFAKNWLKLSPLQRGDLRYAFEKTCKEADVYQALGDIRNIYNVYNRSALITHIANVTDKQLLLKTLTEFKNLDKTEPPTQSLRRAIDVFVSRKQTPDQFGETLLKCVEGYKNHSVLIKPKTSK